jgi:hypothetical protein
MPNSQDDESVSTSFLNRWEKKGLLSWEMKPFDPQRINIVPMATNDSY